jgi:rod shape-determining protein MreC
MRTDTTQRDRPDIEDQLARYGTWLAARVGVPVTPPTLDEPAHGVHRARARVGLVATGSVAIAAAVALVVWLGVGDSGPRSGEPVIVGTQPSTQATSPEGAPPATAALREQLAQVLSDLARIQSVILENQELQELISLQVPGSSEVVVAQIVPGAADNLESTLQIDKGSAEGLAEGMAVVIGGDAVPVLVGRVADVATHTATVRLLQDPDSRISVWIPVYRQAGILQGEGDPERLSIDEVPISADERPHVGQIVETSGRDGSEIPPGLIVGSVAAVDDTPPGGLATHVDVRPIADLERVTHVRVITDYTPGDVVEHGGGTTVDAGTATTDTGAGSGTTTTTTGGDTAPTSAPEATG